MSKEIYYAAILPLAKKLRQNWRTEAAHLPTPAQLTAFTLIELSIVLVIIGLIVGGVLVGQDLIEAAKLRQQVSQIEKYNTAVNTFRIKYNCLPGDCRNAAQFGFPARGSYPGQGDGNKSIEGNHGGYPPNNYGNVQNGEALVFWIDLSVAGLIEESFTAAAGSNTTPIGQFDLTNLHQIIPRSKISDETYILVMSNGPTGKNGTNHWVMDGAKGINNTGYNVGLGQMWPHPVRNIKASHAHAMDKKVDDGLPLTGKVTARYNLHGAPYFLRWAGTASGSTAVAASASTCYDNLNSASNPVTYTTSVNSGNGANCALAFEW